MVTSKEHSARLRILRTCLGMLEHEDGDLVFDQSPEVLRAVNDTVLAIRKNTPVTEEDCTAYGIASASELEVTCRDGKYRFGHKGTGDPVTLIFRDSQIPKIAKP